MPRTKLVKTKEHKVQTKQ